MSKPFIIAEIAQGYEGDEKLVGLYIKSAINAKADAIKFQIFYADELALSDYKYYQFFKKLELPFEVWEKAVQGSHQYGMEFYSDIFGIDSLHTLEAIGVDGYKIHTTDINNIRLLKEVARIKKKVFLSTGGCQLEEINRALTIFEECEVILMYGFQAEPTEIEDNNLNRIKTLKQRYGKTVGFQDHTTGCSNLAFYLPFVALGAGADVIEKHLTLSRVAEMEDYISALTPEEFAQWVSLLKSIYRSLGEGEWKLTEKELLYRGKVRRAVCAARKFGIGEVIHENDVVLKRTDNPNALFEISEVVGQKTRQNIKENLPIERSDIG